MNSILIISYVLTSTLLLNSCVNSRKDKIKLKDIQVLTLNAGQWTTGRRSSPVPQLECVGGYCSQVKPQTVQCSNKGSDGIDIQWECKTEMNNKYKFGKIDVICEGYDYADDDYVLVGSCGLQYSIDAVGSESNTYNNYQNNDHIHRQQYKQKSLNTFSFGFILCVGLVIFAIYYTCLRPNANTGTNRRDNRFYSSGSPPPPGFRDQPSDGCGSTSSDSFGYRSGDTYTSGVNGNRNNTNGFLSGALTGGVLGYLFGSRTNTNYSDQSSYFGSRTTSPPSYFSSSSQSGSSGSSNSRTTSGFGGTKRR